MFFIFSLKKILFLYVFININIYCILTFIVKIWYVLRNYTLPSVTTSLCSSRFNCACS